MKSFIFRNRIAKQDDPQILALIKRNLGHYPSAEGLDDEKILKKLNHSTRVMVMTTLQKKLVGFLSWTEKGHIMLLELCVLDEKYQGQGIATQYMKKLEESAIQKGFDRLQFYVDKKNKDAFRLYHELGFKTVFTHPFMKTCLMEKQLL